MADIFIKIFNLSITASYIVLAVILLRLIFKRAPRWISCLLWAVVGLRLVIPFSLESVLSLIPSAEPIPENITTQAIPTINSGIQPIDGAINPIISENLAPNVADSANPLQIIISVAAFVWLFGIAAMLIYSAISYIRLKLRVRPSIHLRDRIYYCDNIDTPFILGIIRPRIYIPSGICDEPLDSVIKHEMAHLKRGDHLIKPLGFLILSVYWFNPLIWLAYLLLCRDIEAACDEKVIKTMDNDGKRIYSEALVACSSHRRMISACPLAFGEVGVKNRVRSVLSYKKPAFWIIIAALVASVILAVCFLTDPKNDPENEIITNGDIHTEYEGVYMVLDSRSETEDGTATFKVTWHNDTDKEFTFGAQYDIQIKDGEEWKSVDTEKERFWQAIAYLLPAHGTHPRTYSARGYDLSKVGRYRVVSSFYADGEKKNTWIEFDVANDAEGHQAERLKTLKSKYPEYFGIDDTKGIYLYVWQMAADKYNCGLLPIKDTEYTVDELWTLKGISLEDMNLILRNEYTDSKVTIIPYSMPHSSYYYEIDQEYINKVAALFGKNTDSVTGVYSLNENANGEYNGVKIISGNKETVPLSSMLFVESYESYGWLCGDGFGRRSFFDSNGNFAHPIPTIRCDGNIELELGENYSLVKLQVYDIDHNEIGSSIDGVKDLASGIYYVIVEATRLGDFIESENKHEKTTYEYIFGIIVE